MKKNAGYKLTKELEAQYNTPVIAFPTPIVTLVACPVCGHSHSTSAKSKRCYYCGQKLAV